MRVRGQTCYTLSEVNIVVDNLLTAYTLSGKGKLVLMLHGWGDSSKGLAGLRESLDGYKVMAMDLPGFGGTQAPPKAWDLDDYSDFLAKVMDKLELGQPYAVVGHSNGGALAVRAISLGLLRPRRLVLLAAAGVRTGGGNRRLFLKAIAKAGKLATFWLPKRYRLGLRKRLYGAAGSDMLAVPHMEETFKKTVRQDVQADAAALNLPVLLVYADADQAVPLADGRRYQSLIKGSRLEVIEGAGHFLHDDRPDRVAELIKEFLA